MLLSRGPWSMFPVRSRLWSRLPVRARARRPQNVTLPRTLGPFVEPLGHPSATREKRGGEHNLASHCFVSFLDERLRQIEV